MSSFTDLDNESMFDERGLERKRRKFAALAHDAAARWLRRAAEAGRVRYGTDETSTGQRQFRFSAG